MWIWIIIAALVLFIAVPVLRALLRKPKGAITDKSQRNRADWLIAKAWGQSDEKAAPLFIEAHRLAVKSGDGLLASESAVKVGEIRMRQKQYENAVDWFNFALRAKSEPGWQGEHPA